MRNIITVIVIYAVVLGRLDTKAESREIPELPYRTACGPIAMFVALDALGENTGLRELADRVQWKDGTTTSVGQMLECLSTFDRVTATVTSVTTEELHRQLAQGCVAIVPVKKGGTNLNHAIAVTGSKDGRFVYSDYPELRSVMSDQELDSKWDEKAILVARRPQAWLFSNLPWFGLPAVSLGIVVRCLLRKDDRQ